MRAIVCLLVSFLKLCKGIYFCQYADLPLFGGLTARIAQSWSLGGVLPTGVCGLSIWYSWILVIPYSYQLPFGCLGVISGLFEDFWILVNSEDFFIEMLQ